ncbi:MAG: hypothetical protein L0Z50_20845, partial [Verrucomicrobiales bacterium]|nr:hypothetical protein [Verrucomicrobiales bacterium]
LARWFAQEQAVDRKLAEKIGSFPVPTDLKSKLLAARKVVHLPRWWQRPAWLTAAAACVALVVTLVALSIRSSSQARFADFRSFVSAVAGDKTAHLDLMSKDLVAVRQWLNNHNAPDDFVVPAGLNGLPSLGCRVLDWRGQKVSFVCFELENKEMVHLFVMDRSSMRGVPQNGIRELAALDDGVTTLAWSSGKRVYVLASHQGEQGLRRLL